MDSPGATDACSPCSGWAGSPDDSPPGGNLPPFIRRLFFLGGTNLRVVCLLITTVIPQNSTPERATYGAVDGRHRLKTASEGAGRAA
jgi:hypothetical protein